MKTISRDQGFIGLLALLITVAIIALVAMRGDLFGGKSIVEQKQGYNQDIQAAQNAKALMEQRSKEAAENN